MIIDSFGSSWEAVIVTLELDRLMSGGAGGIGYAAALIIVVAIGAAGYASIRTWRRRPGWEIPHLRDELERDWRSLRAKSRTPPLDTLAKTPVQPIGIPEYPAYPDFPITSGNSVPGNDFQVSCSLVLPVMERAAEPVLQDRQDTQDTRRPRTPRKPSLKGTRSAASLSDIAQWAEDRLDRPSGRKIQAQPLHAHYAAWCVARGKLPVTQYAFGLTMRELGWAKDKIGGRIYYRDIAIRAPALKIVMRELSPAL